MQLVGVTHHLRRRTGECPAEDVLAEGRVRRARPEEVRGAADGDVDLPLLVGAEEGVGHGGPGRRLLGGGVSRHRLDQAAPVGCAVGVKVVEDHQPCPGADGSCEDPLLKGWELLRPAGVGAGVETEGDAIGPGTDGGGERGVGCVAGNNLGVGQGVAVPVDRDDMVARGDELADQVTAHLTGTEDDVTAHDASREVGACWRERGRVRSTSGRTEVRRATTRAPLAPKTVNCSSTPMPARVVTVQPAAQAAAR